MNLVEKVLASHCGRKSVTPGEIINAKVDLILGNELSTIVAISEFEKVGAKKVFDNTKIAIVPDHFTPAKDIRTAEICKKIRHWVKDQSIVNYFEVGRGGIEHVVLPDEGLVLPGTIIIGGDSHTVTYGALGCLGMGVGSTDMAYAFVTGEIWLKVPESIKLVFHGAPGKWAYAKDLILFAIGKLGVDGARYKAVEYAGEAIKNLEMTGRLTMSNMVAEMGGKVGVIEPDEKTEEFLRKVTKKKYQIVKSDPDARYSDVHEFDVDEMEPMISRPTSPDNVAPVSEVDGVKLDQVFIGSCTNGRIEDIRLAAGILKGRKVHPDVRMIIVPGSQRVYEQAARENLLEIFVAAGGAVSTPTCGACVGGHMGVLGSNEVCLSTTSRNFVGRMGDVNSRTYLSNPAVAAASAVAGQIVHPDKILNKKVAVPV